MAKEAAKLLNLQTFVHLVGPRTIPGGVEAERRSLLKRFGDAYRFAMVGPNVSDFPKMQTKQGWLLSFNSWAELVRLAGVDPGSPVAATTSEPDPLSPFAPDPPSPIGSMDLKPVEENVASQFFAGGATGGAGGGTAFDTPGEQVPISPISPISLPTVAEVQAEGFEAVPLDSTPVDPVGSLPDAAESPAMETQDPDPA
jgi:hypothetical protein